jgi:hypothetical protein
MLAIDLGHDIYATQSRGYAQTDKVIPINDLIDHVRSVPYSG